jgi:hypothetical protein
MLRMNWLATREPSSHPGIGTANLPVRLTHPPRTRGPGSIHVFRAKYGAVYATIGSFCSVLVCPATPRAGEFQHRAACAFRGCQANTGDVLVLDHRLRSCNQTCPVARCVAAYNRFEISYTLLKLEDYDLGIRSQPQRRSPGSCSARSENLHPPDLA